MGFLLTLLLALIFFSLGLLRPRFAAYGLLAAFTLFEEVGVGFTTLTGSFVFNANFVGFGGFRLIELITAFAWAPMAFLGSTAPKGVAASGRAAALPAAFTTERTLFIVMTALIASLLLLEYITTGKITYATWRVLVTGCMQFHILVMVFRSEEDVLQMVKVLVLLLAFRAAWGLAAWAAGGGVMSARGRLPFFFDSRQVEAFAIAGLIACSYLLNYNAIQKKQRIWSFLFAALIAVVVLGAVLGSIRRTVWVVTLVGLFLVLLMSRRTTALHYFVVVFVAAATVAGLLLAPGLERFRGHMERYVASLNLFDQSQRSDYENDVHVDNVEKYAKLLVDNPDIFAFGFAGPSGTRLESLRGSYSDEYRLGVAHNGILRTTLYFGVVGVLVYVIYHLVQLARTWRLYWRAPEDRLLKHVALACSAKLMLDFGAALFFVPPFWTTSKGVFYTLLIGFVLGRAAQLLLVKAPAVPEPVLPAKAARRAAAL